MTVFHETHPRCVLLLALATPLTLGIGPAVNAGSPDVIQLTGIVRDFHERSHPNGHPDMEKQPDNGFGLYTGNLAEQLGPDGKPVFTGHGAKVTKMFKNSGGMSIAPHMYNRRFECVIEMPSSDCVQISHQASGQHNQASFEVCFVDVSFNGDGTSTWTYQVREVNPQPELSHWTLWLHPSMTVVETNPAGGYWIGDDHPNFPGPGIKWDTDGGVGTKGTLFSVTLSEQYYGTNNSWVQVKGGGGSEYGIAPFFGPSTELSASSSPYKYHWEAITDTSLNDTAGEFGAADTGGITSEQSFNQWFRDVPGVNMSMPLTIALVKQPDGSYVFDDKLDPKYQDLGGFFPIENEIFGQSGGSPNRNFHFTFELHTEFVYEEGGAQYFRFTGDDDVWVFINGHLVIDLGGVHSSLDQIIELDRLCLVDGQKYTLTFFFAERHRTQSNCRIQTNLDLESVKIPSITAMFD